MVYNVCAPKKCYWISVYEIIMTWYDRTVYTTIADAAATAAADVLFS